MHTVIINSLVFSLLVASSNAFGESGGKECFLLSNGGTLLDVVVEGSVAVKSRTVMLGSSLSRLAWPSSGSDGFVYFQGTGVEEGTRVFRWSPAGGDADFVPIVNGIFPSISPNGQYLSFYQVSESEKRFLVMDMKSGKIVFRFKEVDATQPAVWIKNDRIFLNSDKRNFMSIDIQSGSMEDMKMPGLVPGTASPDSRKVLCGTYDGKGVFLVDVTTGELSPVVENLLTSIATSFIWNSKGDAFLYSQQTLKKLLQFRESKDLFLHEIDSGAELKIIPGLSLFGGISYKCNTGSTGISNTSTPPETTGQKTTGHP